MPWSLEICSSQCSPVHRVGIRCISNRDTHLYQPHNNSSVHLRTSTEVRRSGQITDEMRSSWRALRDSILSSPTCPPTILEWPCQEHRGPSLAASAPLMDISTPAYTNWFGSFCCLWVRRRKIDPLTTLFSIFQSIELPMEHMARWFANFCALLCFSHWKT